MVASSKLLNIAKFFDIEDIPIQLELLGDECKIFQGVTPMI